MSSETPRLPEHGTRARYQRGCRCRPCTLDNTLYQRGYRLGLVTRHYAVRGVRWSEPPLPFDTARRP